MEGLYLDVDQLAAMPDSIHWNPIEFQQAAWKSNVFLYLGTYHSPFLRREFDPPTGYHQSTQSTAAPQVPGPLREP